MHRHHQTDNLLRRPRPMTAACRMSGHCCERLVAKIVINAFQHVKDSDELSYARRNMGLNFRTMWLDAARSAQANNKQLFVCPALTPEKRCGLQALKPEICAHSLSPESMRDPTVPKELYLRLFHPGCGWLDGAPEHLKKLVELQAKHMDLPAAEGKEKAKEYLGALTPHLDALSIQRDSNGDPVAVRYWVENGVWRSTPLQVKEKPKPRPKPKVAVEAPVPQPAPVPKSERPGLLALCQPDSPEDRKTSAAPAATRLDPEVQTKDTTNLEVVPSKPKVKEKVGFVPEADPPDLKRRVEPWAGSETYPRALPLGDNTFSPLLALRYFRDHAGKESCAVDDKQELIKKKSAWLFRDRRLAQDGHWVLYGPSDCALERRAGHDREIRIPLADTRLALELLNNACCGD